MKKKTWAKRVLALGLAVVTAVTSWSIDWSGIGESISAVAADTELDLAAGGSFSQMFTYSNESFGTLSSATAHIRIVSGTATLTTHIYGNAANATDYSSELASGSVTVNGDNSDKDINLLQNITTSIAFSKDTNYIIKVDVGSIVGSSAIYVAGTTSSYPDDNFYGYKNENVTSYTIIKPTETGNGSASYDLEGAESAFVGVDGSTQLSVSVPAMYKETISYSVTNGNDLIEVDPVTGKVTGKNAGRGSAIVEANANGATPKKIAIEVLNASVDGSPSYTFDGTAKEPTVKVSNGSGDIESSNFDVAYSGNINAGNLTATVTGKDAYASYSQSISYPISAADLSTLTSDIQSQVKANPYDISGGSATANFDSITIGSTAVSFVRGVDYEITDISSKESGGNIENTLTLLGIGNFTGTTTVTQTGAGSGSDTRIDIKKYIVETSKIDVEFDNNTTQSDYDTTVKSTNVTIDDKPIADVIPAGVTYKIVYKLNNTKEQELKDAGTYTPYVVGTGKYTGSYKARSAITINKFKLNDVTTVTLASNTFKYDDGNEIRPNVTSVKTTINNGEKTLTAKTEYTISYNNNTSVSEDAEVKITGTGNYTGTVYKKFSIIGALDTARFLISADEETYGAYNGNTISYNPKFKDAPFTPTVSEIDFADGTQISDPAEINAAINLAYADNTNAGTATITISANPTGKYNGQTGVKVYFDIERADISGGSFEITSENPITYDGKVHAPKGTLTAKVNDVDKSNFIEGTDYTISYGGNYGTDGYTYAGTYKQMSITGIGNYKGTIKASRINAYTINKLDISSGVTINVANTYTYTGDPIEVPLSDITLTITSTGEKINSSWYSISGYSNDHTNAGIAQVYIKGDDSKSITGTLASNFTIDPAGMTLSFYLNGETDFYGTAEPGVSLTDLWGYNYDASKGPRAWYDYTGSPINPEPKVKNGDTTLTKNKDYKVSFNAAGVDYTSISQNTRNYAYVTVTGMGNYEDIGEVRLRFGIKGRDISNAVIDPVYTDGQISGFSLTYNGNILTEGSDKDYIATYTGLNDGNLYKSTDFPDVAGTYSVTFTGKGNYTGTQTYVNSSGEEQFTIGKSAESLTPSFTQNGFVGYTPSSLSKNAETGVYEGTIPYIGNEARPHINLKDNSADVAYTVTYSAENYNVGQSVTATLTPTDTAKYFGTVQVTYTITKMVINNDLENRLGRDASIDSFDKSLLYVPQTDGQPKQEYNGNTIVYSYNGRAQTIFPKIVFNADAFGENCVNINDGVDGKIELTLDTDYTVPEEHRSVEYTSSSHDVEITFTDSASFTGSFTKIYKFTQAEKSSIAFKVGSGTGDGYKLYGDIIEGSASGGYDGYIYNSTDSKGAFKSTPYTYDGTEKTPIEDYITLSLYNRNLVLGTDYKVEYTNNVNASANSTPAYATATIKLIGSVADYVSDEDKTLTVYFTINKAKIPENAITITTDTGGYAYNDSVRNISYDISGLTSDMYDWDAESVLSASTPGVYTLKINGKGNYEGSAKADWYIYADLTQNQYFVLKYIDDAAGRNYNDVFVDAQKKLYIGVNGTSLYYDDALGTPFEKSNIRLFYSANNDAGRCNTEVMKNINGTNVELDGNGVDYKITGTTTYKPGGTYTAVYEAVRTSSVVKNSLSGSRRMLGQFNANTIDITGAADGSVIDYTGSAVDVTSATLTYKPTSTRLTYLTEYTAVPTGSDFTNAGASFTIKYTPKKDYFANTDYIERSFTIKYNLSRATVTLSPTSLEYTGSDRKGDVIVTVTGPDGNTINAAAYTVIKGEGDGSAAITDKGTYPVTIQPVDTYSYNSNVAYFTIEGKPMGDSITFDMSEGPYTYTGSEWKPEVSNVMDGNKALTFGEDYTVAYTNNINAGTATMTLSGIGNYSGTKTKTFIIRPKYLGGVTANVDKVTYNGKTLSDKIGSGNIRVYDSSTRLTAGRDFDLGAIAACNAAGTQDRDADDSWLAGDSVKVVLKTKDGANYTADDPDTTGVVEEEYEVTVADVVEPADISKDSDARIEGNTATYTGSTITANFTIKLTGNTDPLEEGTDYTVDYSGASSMLNAGKYRVTVAARQDDAVTGGNKNENGTWNIKGTKTFDYEVLQKELLDDSDKYTITIPEHAAWTGARIDLSGQISVTDISRGETLDQGADGDYTVTYKYGDADSCREAAGADPTQEKVPTVIITGVNNYGGSFTKHFSIGEDISDVADITVEPGTYIYDGVTEHKIAGNEGVTVVRKDDPTKELTYGTHYDVTYADGADLVSAGSKTANIVGVPTNGYYGSVPYTYEVEPKPVDRNRLDISLDLSTFYIGSKEYYYAQYVEGGVEPTVTIKDPDIRDEDQNVVVLEKGVDYELFYTNNTHKTSSNLSDMAEVYVTMKGNYEDLSTPIWSEKFYIDGADIGSTDDVELSVGEEFAWTGTSLLDTIKGTISITDVKTGNPLTENKDYSITLNKTPIDVGRYTITFKGMGNYSGYRTEEFIIFGDLSASTTKITIAKQLYTGAKISNPTVSVVCAGKQLTQASGSTGTGDFYVSDTWSVDNYETSATARVIGRDQDLYRWWQDVDFEIGFTGDNFDVTDNTNNTKTDSGVTGYTLSSQYLYTGSPIKPDFRLWDSGNNEITSNKSNATYYDANGVTYKSNKDGDSCTAAGTVTVSIPIYATINGTLKSTTKTLTYQIVPRTISSCDIDEIEVETYTGSAITPSLNVYYKSSLLTESTNSGGTGDYTVTYSNNTNPGTASVTIKGYGNYTGSVTEYFTIKPADVTSVSASAKTKTKMDVSWSAASNVDGYQVIYKQDGQQRQVNVSKNKTSTTLTGMDQATTYDVQVRSYVLVGNTKYYGTAGETSAATKPATPTIKVTQPASGQVKISWKKNSDATGYVVYRSTSKNGKYTKVKTITSKNTTGYINKNRKAGKTYYYYVKAYVTKNNKTTYSAASKKVGITVK